MKLYSMLDGNTNQEISKALNIELAGQDCSINGADISVLYFKSGQGFDFSDIGDKNNVLLVAEIKNKNDEQAVMKAIECGVFEDNIFVVPPGGGVKPHMIIEKVGPLVRQLSRSKEKVEKTEQEEQVEKDSNKSTENIIKPVYEMENSTTSKEKDAGSGVSEERIEKTETEDKAEKIENKNENTVTSKDNTPPGTQEINSKPAIENLIVAFACYKGGVGNTSLATSLMAHYSDLGETVCLFDLSYTATAIYHLGEDVEVKQKGKSLYVYGTSYGDLIIPNTAPGNIKVEWVKEMTKNLKDKNKYVIVDMPVSPTRELEKIFAGEAIVYVVDHDIFQTVEPTSRKINNTDNVFIVYNKAVPEVTPGMVPAYFKKPVEEIKMDRESCIAALAENIPPSLKSEEFAGAAGRLANSIHHISLSPGGESSG